MTLGFLLPSFSSLLFILSLCGFFFGCMVFRILIPQPGIDPRPLAAKAQNPNYGPPGNTPFSFVLAVCPLFLLLFQPLQYFVYIIGLRAPRLVVKKGAVPAFTPPSAPPHSSDFILMNILSLTTRCVERKIKEKLAKIFLKSLHI